LDFIQTLALVDDSRKRLQNLRTDEEYLKLIDETKLFVNKNNEQETEFKVLRSRWRKVMPRELAVDEILLSPTDRYKTEVYFSVLEAIVMFISTRFDQSREIFKDLCLLSLQRIFKYSNGIIKTLPDDAFNEIEDWLHGININDLKNEYLTLSSPLKGLLDSCPTLIKQLHKNISKEQNECSQSDGE